MWARASSPIDISESHNSRSMTREQELNRVCPDVDTQLERARGENGKEIEKDRPVLVGPAFILRQTRALLFLSRTRRLNPLLSLFRSNYHGFKGERIFNGHYTIVLTYIWGAYEQKDSSEDWIRITSNDGYSFLVKRKVATRSGTLKSMLDEDSAHPLALEDPNCSTEFFPA